MIPYMEPCVNKILAVDPYGIFNPGKIIN